MTQELFRYYIIERGHHALRHKAATLKTAEKYAAEGLSYRERMADRFARAAAEETLRKNRDRNGTGGQAKKTKRTT